MLDTQIEHTLADYEEWCRISPREKPVITVAYVSAYGYTQQLAKAITDEIRANKNVDVHLFEVTAENHAQVLEFIFNSDAFMLGTPTILGDALRPIFELTLDMHPILVKGKIATAFGSYGWSGEGVPNIMGRLQQLKLKTVDGFKIRFQPSEKELDDAREYAKNFVEQVLSGK